MNIRFLLIAAVMVTALLVVHPDAGAQSPSASALALAGMPDTNRAWTSEDYTKAADLLSRRGVQLPSASDRRGAIILQRLTSLENLAALRNEKVPAAARLGECSRIMLGASAILSKYVSVMGGKNERFGDEVVRQMVFILHASAASIELMDELLAAQPQNEKNPGVVEAFRKARAGVNASFMGAAGSLSVRDYYSESELSTLLEAMAATLPRIKKALDSEAAVALVTQLETHKAFLHDRSDILKTESMIAEVKRLDQYAEAMKGRAAMSAFMAYPELSCDGGAAARKEVRVRHIVVEPSPRSDPAAIDEAFKKATEARVELAKGQPFEKVEAKYSQGAITRGARGGDLGYVKRGVMVPGVEKAAFCLSVRELSPVIPTEFGFHIVQVTAVR